MCSGDSKLNVEVIAYGYLMTLIGGKIVVELNNKAVLEDLISKLTYKIKSPNEGYIGPYKVGSDLIVLINGRNIKTLKEPLSLNDGDVVTLIPPFVGG